MKLGIPVFLILVSLDVYAKSETVYGCKVEASTGFAYKRGVWRVARFDAGQEFILRPLKEAEPGFNSEEKNKYGVFEAGQTIPELFCSADEDPARIVCSGLGELLFSPDTGRFVRTFPFGSVYPGDDNKARPKIMRGRCEKR